MSKTLKVTCSGSFKASDGDIESFDNVIGFIPAIDEDKATQMVIRRYAMIWIAQARKMVNGKTTDEAKYKRVTKVRQVFIDSIEDNEAAPNAQLSFIGKNIMEMNFEELQDFAAANDLSAVPLYKVGSLVHARRVAFSEYAIKVLQLEEYAAEDKNNKQNLYDYRVQGFNPSRFEPLIADELIRRSGKVVQSLEESIDREALVADGKLKPGESAKGSRLTMDNLKTIAEQRNISFNKGISYDALYKKIYGAKAA